MTEDDINRMGWFRPRPVDPDDHDAELFRRAPATTPWQLRLALWLVKPEAVTRGQIIGLLVSAAFVGVVCGMFLAGALHT
jgi:hypothetical protein